MQDIMINSVIFVFCKLKQTYMRIKIHSVYCRERNSKGNVTIRTRIKYNSAVTYGIQ